MPPTASEPMGENDVASGRTGSYIRPKTCKTRARPCGSNGGNVEGFATRNSPSLKRQDTRNQGQCPPCGQLGQGPTGGRVNNRRGWQPLIPDAG